MPTRIVITGAAGHVGCAVLDTLWDSSAETVALVRTPRPLRASRIIVGSLFADLAQQAMRSADVVIHLAGVCRPERAETYYGSNVASAAAVAEASRDSNVKRIIILSVLGADECSSNEYLKTKARAEHVLLAVKIPTVVFRSSHIIGDPRNPGMFAETLLSRDGEPVKVLGHGRQMVAPVFLGDVARAITRAVESKGTGTYELSGPDAMSMDDLARLLNGSDLPLQHLPARLAMYLPRVSPMSSGWVEVVTNSCVGNPSRAIKEFGLAFHSLRSIWNDRREGASAKAGIHSGTCEPLFADV